LGGECLRTGAEESGVRALFSTVLVRAVLSCELHGVAPDPLAVVLADLDVGAVVNAAVEAGDPGLVFPRFEVRGA
jgi:hypothetical protein